MLSVIFHRWAACERLEALHSTPVCCHPWRVSSALCLLSGHNPLGLSFTFGRYSSAMTKFRLIHPLWWVPPAESVSSSMVHIRKDFLDHTPGRGHRRLIH
jgi:hypothetical protein